MVKRVADGVHHADNVAWIPWDDRRSMPFRITGSTDGIWVKVLGREPETGAESLLYRFEAGWSAESVENTAAENLFVWQGELTWGEVALPTSAYAYRPVGFSAGPCSSPTGAVVISYAAGPNERLSSGRAVPCLDTAAMPWEPFHRDKNGEVLYWLKMLRGDEENLEVLFLLKARPHVSEGNGEGDYVYSRPSTVASHDGPEEAFFLDGRSYLYDGNLDAPLLCSRGTFVHRGPYSKHRTCAILEEQITYSHDYFSPENAGEFEQWLSSYPVDTPAVVAAKAGRDPGLPKRW
jgi:hypothetical protein